MNSHSSLTSHLSPLIPPVPSLFTFNIEEQALRDLMGTVVEATAMIPGTKMRASGPLLITHWGMSGPCILRLSSYAARLLSEHQYQMPLSVNWTSLKENEVQEELQSFCRQYAQKQLPTMRPFDLPQRLWNYLTEKALAGRARGESPCWQSTRPLGKSQPKGVEPPDQQPHQRYLSDSRSCTLQGRVRHLRRHRPRLCQPLNT